MKKHHPVHIIISDRLGKEFRFESLQSFLEFSNHELNFWSEIKRVKQRHGGQFNTYLSAANYFQTIIKTIGSWQENIDHLGEQELQSQVQQQIINAHSQNLRTHWLWSEHSSVERWIEIDNQFGKEVSDAFIHSIVGTGHQTASKQQLYGTLLAYEFELQGESNLTKRRESEEITLERIKADLSNKHTELIDHVSELEQDFADWSDQSRQKTERISRINFNCARRQRKSFASKFESTMQHWQEEVKTLEQTYREKLRLDGPSQYWKRSAEKFKLQGTVWGIILFITLFIGLMGFSSFFQLWLKGQELGIELSTMQGAAIFITIVSAFAFLVTILAKMTLSSFHLQRDAEEREQLTHLYLSLSNETEVDPETRKIVLQSLFSRADTGLLGKDGGTPAMPMIDMFRKN